MSVVLGSSGSEDTDATAACGANGVVASSEANAKEAVARVNGASLMANEAVGHGIPELSLVREAHLLIDLTLQRGAAGAGGASGKSRNRQSRVARSRARSSL